ncbi:copper amine oxidase N-terminal domain-containing protein [Paenibacillus sp.]|uniref:copper amine oxidase N-terminal domain-containing protein n=1 Tax=Paenibacillus sp. TaxID=58172 RepID=UPI002D61998C|nr:copper amine oxidase N-terminal domain-containing protein [Paenibacillus sp.]HZG84444.1 copper amine oxidase N-terminal domain-containing protein [Paenibacillus sp.]
MKTSRWTKLAAAFALLLTTGLPGAATAEEKPIRIWFNGEELVADAPAYIAAGTTFVPFRALFERLGMEVSWDAATKTVTGRGGGKTLTLTVGAASATVDGTAKPLLAAPAIVGGRTFVPLRFVSETAGASVAWDGAERSIRIASGPSAEEQQAGVKAAYEAYLAAANREDAAAVLRLVHAASPLRASLRTTLADAYARRDVRTTLESLVVESVHGGVATLRVTEANAKTAGAFYVDNRVDMKVTMRQGTDGAWRLYDAALLSREWTSPFGTPPGEASAPEEETVARNTIAAYMEALNQEDVNAALKIVHADSPMRKATEATLPWMFGAYDLVHELESLTVLERSQDEMYVHTVQTMRKSAGPKLADRRTETIHTLRRLTNGQWKLYSTIEGRTEILSIPH